MHHDLDGDPPHDHDGALPELAPLGAAHMAGEQQAQTLAIRSGHEVAGGATEAGPLSRSLLSDVSTFAERIVEATPAALLALDADLRVRRANPAYYALFHTGPEDTEQRAFFEIGDGQWDVPWLRAALGQASALGLPLVDAEITIDDPRIGRRTMQLNARPLMGSEVSLPILLLIEDVTDRTVSEQQRQTFILLLAHELRTPLTAMLGYLQLMQRRATRGAFATRDEAALGVILSNARHMNRLVGDLLDGSQRGLDQVRLARRQMDLTTLAHVAVRQAQDLAPDHVVRLEAPTTPLIGLWDSERLAQVFANLLNNAVKYSPDGGEIVVWIDDLGATARVSIQDHGVGISPDEAPHLFDQYYRVAATARQVDGLGLGLHVVKMLVEAHGGTLGVESMIGMGSTFYFTLPLTPLPGGDSSRDT